MSLSMQLRLPVPWFFSRDPLARERRRIAASGLFDASWYLINGADVAEAGADPLSHFCAHGWREGRRPNPYFDPDFYRERHLAGAGENPLLHYIARGERVGCRPIPFFDPAWYRATYGQARPLAHFLAHRRTQGFAPNPWFDLPFYLGRHGAEIGGNRDPFMHHVRNGAALRDLDPSPTFDAAAYRRDAMAGDARTWIGLTAHEMRVPLIHFLRGT